jgi:uncharacterized cupin superfamily protein
MDGRIQSPGIQTPCFFMQIFIEHNPSPAKLDVIGVYDWPIWTKEVSTFPWKYDQRETCYLLEGDVTVTPDGGQPVRIVAGDLVTFPAGLSCTWEIREAVRKHYDFG